MLRLLTIRTAWDQKEIMTENNQLGLAGEGTVFIIGSVWQSKQKRESYDYWNEVIIKATDAVGMILFTPKIYSTGGGQQKWLSPFSFEEEYEPKVAKEAAENG